MEREEVVQMDENLKLESLISVDKSSLPADGGPFYNRLIFARSPYLLQHAKNPVDWYPWGEEAFAKAEKENKPLFVSIGYATCHWCHVMEHESFEDENVAAVLNRHFVPIKVDREERPDVDDQFMTVAQMLKGGAGWPLNVFLTRDRKPFYVATYVPKESRDGNLGMVDLLAKIADVWTNQREDVESSCAAILESLAETAAPKPAPIPGAEALEAAFWQIEMAFDRTNGGFGSAPKFPRPMFLSFLLPFWKRMENQAALEMLEQTLGKMRRGGIYDQLGFGFHRYSVDQNWLVPHFEKMLYDQAMMAMVYLDAYLATGNGAWKDVAEEIFSYVHNEMTSPEGAFYSARDADTEGVEGKFYLWTPAEVTRVLGEESGRLLCELFDISEGGNFEGKNILHLPTDVDQFAVGKGIPPESFRADLESWRKQLISAREQRIKPLRDEKIITSWNGLMIAALAKGYAICGDISYLEMAERAARFITDNMTRDGRLLRSHFLGESSIPGFLEDYACLAWGFTNLYEATLDPDHLASAHRLNNETLRLFADEDNYGLFDNGSDAEKVLIRKKSVIDGVVPSGNSVAAMNFLRMGKIKNSRKFLTEGEGILRSMMGDAQENPLAYLFSLVALDFLHGPDLDVTLVGDTNDPVMREMLGALYRRYLPHMVLRIGKEDGENGYRTIGGKPAAYVCHAQACRRPVSGGDALNSLLDELLKEAK